MSLFLKKIWNYLKEWSGENAYEQFLIHYQKQHQGATGTVPSKKEFYKKYFVDRSSKPRCC